jgi:hypothetical protein
LVSLSGNSFFMRAAKIKNYAEPGLSVKKTRGLKSPIW